ncbi:MAG: tyrosine-protein phosphatase [Solirubrobacteraceae bacterium]
MAPSVGLLGGLDAWPQFGTPMYYGPHLERFPQRSAAVVSAIARARPGGVVFHCVGGRDRTGQIAMILLSLLGASPQTIAADYELTDATRAAVGAANGFDDDTAQMRAAGPRR